MSRAATTRSSPSDARPAREIVAQTERKARKLEREIGPLQFEPESNDRALLQLLMRWKSDQYARTGHVDQFSIPWNVALIERIHAATGPNFGGSLSVLRAGDRVAALVFADAHARYLALLVPDLRSRLAAYSRVILLLRITQEAASRGMRIVDLGKDEAVYKMRFRTGVIDVGEGRVVPSSSLAALVRLHGGCVAVARQTPLAKPCGLKARSPPARRRGRACLAGVRQG